MENLPKIWKICQTEKQAAEKMGLSRYRKGRSLRKKPIRGVFRLQSQVFQNLKSSEKPHAACQKNFFDKLVIDAAPPVDV